MQWVPIGGIEKHRIYYNSSPFSSSPFSTAYRWIDLCRWFESTLLVTRYQHAALISTANCASSYVAFTELA
jgi:hypothetical protein